MEQLTEWAQLSQMSTNVLLLGGITVIWRKLNERDKAYDALFRECITLLTRVSERLTEAGHE